MTSRVKTVARQTALTAGRAGIRGFGMITASMRPDPDFLLIGAKRGGSTSFYYDLITHPQVALLFPRPDRLPKATATKGVHYFDSNYYRGHRWYASHLPSARVRQAQSRAAGGPVVTGEGSPYYLTHPAAAERAARDLPSVKLIAVLRDPVLRAHSHWKERVREGKEQLTFREAVDQEATRVGADAEKLRRDPRFYSYAHEQQSYLEQSRYAAALERWFEHFPRSSFLIIRSEDYYEAPTRELDHAADFLGILPGRFETGDALNAAPGDSLDAATRREVENRLRDDAIRLRELTGITWDWV